MNRKSNSFAASRRRFLRLGVAGAGVVALGTLANRNAPFIVPARAAPLPNHKRLVIINMIGGNDGLNMVIPNSGVVQTKYAAQRATIGIAPGAGLSLAGGPNVTDFQLHPSMTNLQTIWNANQLGLVWKVGYPNDDLSHFVSEDIWSTAVRAQPTNLGTVAPGWVARYANLYASTSLGVMSLGVGRRLDFAGANVSPLLVSSLSAFNYKSDANYTSNHVLRLQKVQAIVAAQPQVAGDTASSVAAAQLAGFAGAQAVQTAIVDYTAYASGAGIVYPNSTMGNRLRDVARVIYGGFESRIIYTGYGGFDTHGDQQPAQAGLIAQLDAALGVFRNDMTTMGVWNDVVVVVISEFGRRNYENGSVGTDHGHGNVMLVLGGPVKGDVYGGITGADMDEEHLPYDTDFRDVYREIIGGHLGNDPTPLFPDVQPITNIPDLI